MKKLFVLLLLFFTTQSMAIVVDDWNGMCGAYKYDSAYAVFEPISYTCSAGTYLPKQTPGCVACPIGFTCFGGTFAYNENNDQGIALAVYNCNSGYFLPAGSETCTACPTGWSCPGGSFNFNSTKYQGLTKSATYMAGNENGVCASNYGHRIYATFQINTHTCGAGYYLPAGVDACTLCPSGSACAGGTYSFNETTDQGIVACEAGTYAPTGSSVCYQHILHVGDDIVYLRSTKLTTPSLNIQIGNDVFYANMTTVPTYMNKDSSHYLHILYEGDDYYVCDDTTYSE